jgi:8-oxo-dGTP diphosphatase
MRKITQNVGAMFINPAGAVLLGLRSASKIVRPNRWDLIGGHVEAGESRNDALIRESQEEVGITPLEFGLLAIFREPEPERYGDASHHVFSVTNWQGGDPTNKSNEHSELRWFTLDEIRTLTNIADTRYELYARVALAGRQTPQVRRAVG